MRNDVIKFLLMNSETIGGVLWLFMDFCWMHDHTVLASLFGIMSVAAGICSTGLTMLDSAFDRNKFMLNVAALLWICMNICWMWTLETLGSILGVLAMFVLGWTFLSSPFVEKHFGRFFR